MRACKLTISLIIFAWSAGFFYFNHYVNNITNTNREVTQSIIVYGGNKERLYVGSQLLKLGYASIIFITGNKPEGEYTNFIRVNKLVKEQFLFDQELANNSHKPIDDALAFMKKYQLNSARIVINATQLPRAKLELASKAHHGFAITFYTVSKKNKQNFNVLIEYIKYNLMLFASFLGMEHELNLSYS